MDVSDDFVVKRTRKAKAVITSLPSAGRNKRKAIVVENSRNRSTMAWRGRQAIGTKLLSLQANGFDCVCLVRNPKTGDVWTQCSEGYWNEFLGGLEPQKDDSGSVILYPLLPNGTPKVRDDQLENMSQKWMNMHSKNPLPFRENRTVITKDRTDMTADKDIEHSAVVESRQTEAPEDSQDDSMDVTRAVLSEIISQDTASPSCV